MSKETKLKTVQKWQEEFNFGLDYDQRGGFVTAVRCKLCKNWESCIKSINGNNDTWVREGSKYVEKNTLKNILKVFHKRKQQLARKEKILELRNTLKR